MSYRKKNGMYSRDYISNLPDDIISNVLSRLYTKEAVQTCVLSKAWENKWTSAYNIDIYEWEFRGRWLPFAKFVDRVLLNAHNVRGFTLCTGNHPTEEDRALQTERMETWLSAVFSDRHNVEEVAVICSCSFVLPRSLSKCTSLRELEMQTCCTWKPPVHNYFPNLTRLYLSEVEIMNENPNTDTLIFHFPVLKTFETREVTWENVTFVELNAPALISVLSDNTIGEDSRVINIVGESLQKLETEGRYLENFVVSGSLVSCAALKNEDDVDDSDDGHDSIVKCGQRIRRLMKQFSRLKSLKLTCYVAQALAKTKSGLPLPRFAKLERLALCRGLELCSGGNIEGVFEGLFELLRSAPVLKYLVVERFPIDPHGDYDFNMMEPVPSCVVSHLEEVELNCDSGEIHELHLARYILENGAQLKNFSLCCWKDEVRNQLSNFPKASTSLKLTFT